MYDTWCPSAVWTIWVTISNATRVGSRAPRQSLFRVPRLGSALRVGCVKPAYSDALMQLRATRRWRKGEAYHSWDELSGPWACEQNLESMPWTERVAG